MNKLSICWYCFPLIGCSYSTSALNFPFSWSSLPPWKTWILGRTLLDYSKSIGLITTLQPITVVRFFWFLPAVLSSLRNLEIFLRYFLTSRQVFLQLLLLAYNHDRNPPDGLVNTSVVLVNLSSGLSPWMHSCYPLFSHSYQVNFWTKLRDLQ